MDYDDLNDLEKIGLAFISGVIAGTSLEKQEDDDEEEENIKSGVIKLEGDKAKKFIDYIENNLINKNKEEK